MKFWIAAAMALIVSACATQKTEPRYYLLRSDVPVASATLDPSRAFAMGDVYIAPYIDQPGLLLEIAPGEVRAARYHLWAEPIREGITTFLMQEVSRLTGENLLPSSSAAKTTRINIRIDQLHGTRDGQARLVAYWWLSDEGVMTSASRFAESLPLATEGYAALASAEKQLLAQLAARIGHSMTHSAQATGPQQAPDS